MSYNLPSSAEPGTALSTNTPVVSFLPSVQYLLGGGISKGHEEAREAWHLPE